MPPTHSTMVGGGGRGAYHSKTTQEFYSDGSPSGSAMPMMVDYGEHYHEKNGSVGAAEGTLLMHDNPEVALTTGLVTLSVHEALTFDGVELALHPDVFHSSHSTVTNTKAVGNNASGGGGDGCGVQEDGITTLGVSGGKHKQQQIHQHLRPGDLVEIRVWNARPGVTSASTSPSKCSSNPSSVLKSKANAGGGTSQHSRNPSLATISSASMSALSPGVTPGMGSIRSASLYSGNPSSVNISAGSFTTPGSVYNVSPIVTSQPPPVPSVVGGDGASPMGSSVASFSHTGMLYGESLLESSEEAGATTGESRSGVLHGENLHESTVTKESPATIASNLSSAASTLLAGAASTLFRNLNQPTSSIPSAATTGVPTVPSLSQDKKTSSLQANESTPLQGVAGDGSSSVLSHSRDSSLVTNSTVGAMHSRDSSLITTTLSFIVSFALV